MNTRSTEVPGAHRVLVVDDNPLNVMLVRTLLAQSGIALEEAGNARQALTAVSEFKPHLILLDLHLPDIDGLALARQIRADPANARVRIVVISADTAGDVEAPVRAAGCDGFLPKPLDYGTFLDTIRRWLGDPTP